jgi:hypothetical protein
MIQFSEFIETKYPTNEYPNKESSKGQIKKKRCRKAKKKTLKNPV